MRAGGFPGNPGGLVVSILKTAGARAPAHQARGRGRRTWRPTERTAGARMVPPGEGNEARGDGRRGVGVSHSTAEAGELSPRDPVEGRGHRQVAPLEGKTANTPRLGPVSTSRQRIAELARQALGMAVAIAWLPGPAGTRRRVAKLSVEEPDAAEPARPDLWGARVSNDPGLPDHSCPPPRQAQRFYWAEMKDDALRHLEVPRKQQLGRVPEDRHADAFLFLGNLYLDMGARRTRSRACPGSTARRHGT